MRGEEGMGKEAWRWKYLGGYEGNVGWGTGIEKGVVQ